MKAFAWLFLLLALPALGASADGKRGELKDLRSRIEALRTELGKSEQSRANVADQLRDAESAISTTNRRLRELGENRAALQEEIGLLEKQSDALGVQIGNQQRQLADLLYRRYLHGETDALQLLLVGQDPNRIAQDRYFLIVLSRAKVQMLGRLRDALARKQQLVETRRGKAEQLVTIERQQQTERSALVAKQKERQAVLGRIAGAIRAQRREIGTLRNDEKRLAKLIAGLSKIVRSPPKRKHAQPAPPANEPPGLRVDATPEADLAYAGDFAALKGRLRLPVKGEIVGRFGKPRAEGGLWKGLFIRSAEGAEVRAVAPGRVVFSDWLRGFGNLLIIDHGGNYLSIYGNNQSLYRETGQSVGAGQAVAAAGSSGGGDESGLYFELRYQGQPFDPLKWAALR